MVVVSRKFKPPSTGNSPSIQPSYPFYLFLESTLLAIFFGKIAPIKYRINTKINSSGKVISSCLKDYKTTLHDFLCETLLYVTPA